MTKPTQQFTNYPRLHLNLTAKWFNMIDQNLKQEEYREIKPFYTRIFTFGKIKIKGKLYDPTDVVLVFSNGYAKDRRQIECFCKGLKVGLGNPDWGAEMFKRYYILKIGDQLPF